MLLEGKLFFVTKQDKASKDTFVEIHLIFHTYLSLKISHLKLKNVTQGRGQKSVTYYLNGPSQQQSKTFYLPFANYMLHKK
jgi:hypothetical protein